MKTVRLLIIFSTMMTAVKAWAEIPTVLTDTISKGDGVIDIFKDATGAELEEYLQSGTLYLGVDLNEDASGLESSTSAGVAIKQMELIITTTEGDFSFTEFYTNTTAMIQEAGATEAQEYNTLFGSAGGSDITGGPSSWTSSSATASRTTARQADSTDSLSPRNSSTRARARDHHSLRSSGTESASSSSRRPCSGAPPNKA